MKKKFYTVCTTACVFALLLTNTACVMEKPTNTGEKAIVSGTFTYSKAIKNNKNTAVLESVDGAGNEIYAYYTPAGNKTDLGDALRIFNSKEQADISGDMYSTAYPFNTVSGSRISYSVNQSLKIKKDFSYIYNYSITLTNMEEWGKDCAKIEVSMAGTFTAEEIDADNPDTALYSVTLAQPTSGTQRIYGATVNGEGSIYNWMMNASPTYVLDIEMEKLVDENYQPNRYLAGRTVIVDKMEKALQDDIYYSDILNDVAPYSECTF